MPKKTVARRYTISDADLKQLADALLNSLNRDIAAFAARNINAGDLTALEMLIVHFDNTTTDVELLGRVSVAAEAKDEVAGNLRRAIRAIRHMAKSAYGRKGKYSIFGFDNLGNLTGNDLCRLGRRVARVGTQLQTDLIPQGLKLSQLTSISLLATQLDAAIDALAIAAEARDLQTQDRVLKGNILWLEMTRLAFVGRSIFEDSNFALYNDYILVGRRYTRCNLKLRPTGIT